MFHLSILSFRYDNKIYLILLNKWYFYKEHTYDFYERMSLNLDKFSRY